MGMPHLSILAIANLHQTCLGLVWRFAQDGLLCDGDIPANNLRQFITLTNSNVCQHLSSTLVSGGDWWK